MRHGWDYYYDPNQYNAPYRNIGLDPDRSRGLNLCEGDYENDGDCNADLTCHYRRWATPVL